MPDRATAAYLQVVQATDASALAGMGVPQLLGELERRLEVLERQLAAAQRHDPRTGFLADARAALQAREDLLAVRKHLELAIGRLPAVPQTQVRSEHRERTRP